MNRINIANPSSSTTPRTPRAFAAAWPGSARRLGAVQMGTSVYELPPGQALCPYHYEYREEEWLLVLEGRPTLRDPDGDDRARAVGPGLLPDRARRGPTGFATRPPRR